MPELKTDCKETGAIRRLFEAGQVTGASQLVKLTFIGPYISDRAAHLPPNFLGLGPAPQLRTVSDLVRLASLARTKKKIDQLLEYCTYNKRRNTCVPQGGKPKYHVPDVNVCGYNSLLATLKYAHANREVAGMPAQYNVAAALTLKPRNRGTSGGSRYCSCIEDHATCMAHNGDCLWNGTHSTCQSRSQGRQPGFKGVRRNNNHHLAQRLPQAQDTTRGGKVYKGGWQQPTADQPANQAPVDAPDPEPDVPNPEPDAPDEPDAPVPEPANQAAYRTRSGRAVRHPDRFQGGGRGDHSQPLSRLELHLLDGSLRQLEALHGGKLVDARRMRNFVHLTSF